MNKSKQLDNNGFVPIIRKYPRATFWIDLCLQWLTPEFYYDRYNKFGFLNLGYLTVGFGFGTGRDTLWDTLDRGLVTSVDSAPFGGQ